jgi:hypothetical protein
MLQNQQGVIVTVRSTGEGFRFKLSAGGVSVKLKS